jgi:hypothetical protein
MKNLNWMTMFLLLLISVAGNELFAANYVVSGAGSIEVNGTYVETGTWNEKPLYIFNNDGTEYAIGYEMGRWMIGQWEGGWLMGDYEIMSEDDTPPSTGWTGWPEPAPTVELEGKSLSYSTSLFTEHANNDGSIANTIVITYNEYGGDAFTGNIDDNFITDSKVTVGNVPAGLTASIIKTAGN